MVGRHGLEPWTRRLRALRPRLKFSILQEGYPANQGQAPPDSPPNTPPSSGRRLVVISSRHCVLGKKASTITRYRYTSPGPQVGTLFGLIHNPHCCIYFRSPSLARTLVPRT